MKRPSIVGNSSTSSILSASNCPSSSLQLSESNKDLTDEGMESGNEDNVEYPNSTKVSITSIPQRVHQQWNKGCNNKVGKG